jgi:hypothetical protein
MHRTIVALGRSAVLVALVATIALGLASAARSDDWARDDVAARAIGSLDPAIRTAIAAHTVGMPSAPAIEPSTSAADDGFAWFAAALGVGVGVAVMCAVFGCVTLVRHDGRLRNA